MTGTGARSRRVALVVGGTGLLGSAICQRLARDGVVVVVGCRTATDRAQELVAELRDAGADAWSVRADIGDAAGPGEMVAAATEVAGPIEILVVAAGQTLRSLAIATSAQATEQLVKINVTGTIAVVRAVLRPMMRARWGRIILLGSRAGSVGMASQSSYAASKAAMVGYAASLAGEVGRFGITVNVIAPGAIEEPAGEGLYSDADQRAVQSLVGLRRLGRPGEVAAVVSFLTSDDAAYISGVCLPVDGAARF